VFFFPFCVRLFACFVFPVVFSNKICQPESCFFFYFELLLFFLPIKAAPFSLFDFSLAMSSAATVSAHVASVAVSATNAASSSSGKTRESALMTSLFSPSPLSSSQSAMAEASVSAISAFSIPAAYDASLQNKPDSYSVLVHSRQSSLNHGGFQAVIVLHPKSDIPSHLGLSGGGGSSSSSSSNRLEETAHLMTAGKNQPFVSYGQAPRASVMLLTVTEYLTLLTWVQREWTRLAAKLAERAKSMRESDEPITVAGHLSFYSHGSCHYRISLSPRLTFRARSDSRLTRDEESVRAWLELRSGGDNKGSIHELSLPMDALSFLAGEECSVSALVEAVADYKSRSRKRSKPVTGCH